MSPGHDDKNFEVIVDCTNYSTMSEVPMQWFKFFLETTPSDLRERFKILHLLNCNQHMTKLLRKLYNICSGESGSNTCHSLLSVYICQAYFISRSGPTFLLATSSLCCTWTSRKCCAKRVSGAFQFPTQHDLTLCLGSLEQEDKEEYKNVMLRQAHLMKSPINITVAQTHLRIDHASTK